MSETVRNICIEALNRTNLVPRKRQAPADMLEDAYQLFKGLVRKYNFANFISYARDEVTLAAPAERNVVAPENHTANSVASVEFRQGDSDWVAMRFVAYDLFSSDNDDYTYSWKFSIDGDLEVFLKPRFLTAAARTVKVVYNVELEYGLDDEVKAPSIYVELFTAALAYKLSVTKPRQGATQSTQLKDELDDAERIVRGMISSQKVHTRQVTSLSNYSAFQSGAFLF